MTKQILLCKRWTGIWSAKCDGQTDALSQKFAVGWDCCKLCAHCLKRKKKRVFLRLLRFPFEGCFEIYWYAKTMPMLQCTLRIAQYLKGFQNRSRQFELLCSFPGSQFWCVYCNYSLQLFLLYSVMELFSGVKYFRIFCFRIVH